MKKVPVPYPCLLAWPLNRRRPLWITIVLSYIHTGVTHGRLLVSLLDTVSRSLSFHPALAQWMPYHWTRGDAFNAALAR